MNTPKLKRRLLRVASDATVPESATIYRRMIETGLLKVPFVAGLVDELAAEGESVLVVGVHEPVLAAVETALVRVPDVGRLSVAGFHHARSLPVRRFRTKTNRVLVAHMGALAGFSFHEVCRHVVFAELDPTPGAHVQAEARVCRAGSPWPEVVSHIPICDVGTDHEVMAEMGETWLSHADPTLGLRPVVRAA